MCNQKLKTGIHHTGFCEIAGRGDTNLDTVCAIVTEEYLQYAKSQDVDIRVKHHYFNKLKPGSTFCVGVDQWMQAMAAGVAPRVVSKATNSKSLWKVSLSDLKAYSS